MADSDEVDGSAGIQISEILKNRMQAKKRRIQECFEAVKSPSEMLGTLQNQSVERGQALQKLKQKSDGLKATVQKIEAELQKHFELTKDSLNNLKESLKQFDHETEKLLRTQDEDSRKHLEEINKELIAVQRQILHDSKEDAESIAKILKNFYA